MAGSRPRESEQRTHPLTRTNRSLAFRIKSLEFVDYTPDGRQAAKADDEYRGLVPGLRAVRIAARHRSHPRTICHFETER